MRNVPTVSRFCCTASPGTASRPPGAAAVGLRRCTWST
ncbi:Uncharacterised protein [Bordetella pertussis]|nr:Uncharacterised protein [Bordetella pertussis]